MSKEWREAHKTFRMQTQMSPFNGEEQSASGTGASASGIGGSLNNLIGQPQQDRYGSTNGSDYEESKIGGVTITMP